MGTVTPDLSVKIKNIKLSNPLVTCSGTSGNGRELSRFLDLNTLGAFTTKSVTLDKRPGNPTPRIAECAGGILNAIGIQSKGINSFIEEDLTFLESYAVPIIVSISANYEEDYARLAEILDECPRVSAIEVNISCPNLKSGGSSFGADPTVAGQIIKAVKAKTCFPVIAKLTPNVTDITTIAKSVEENGADVISMINTLGGMAIDITTRRPKLGNVTGGLSGPGIKPVAIKMIWDTFKAVSIPIIGMGGVTGWEDVIEFILAGSTAVGVGTTLMANPMIIPEILTGLEQYMFENGIGSLSEIRGMVSV